MVVAEIDRFDDAFDTLWQDYRDRYAVVFWRDAATLNWRYVDNPFWRHRIVRAEKDGKLIGLTHYLFHRHAWKIENVVYLQDLFVSKDARGTGAGRALIEAVYAEADKAGCPAVYWLTQDFNSTARQLYDRVAHLTPFIRYSR